MTIFNVKTSGNNLLGDGSAALPWRDITFGQLQLTAGVGDWDTSPDELHVWHDPALAYAESVVGPNKQGIVTIGVDAEGNGPDDDGWDGSRVVVDASGLATAGLAWGTNYQHMRNFHIQGGGTNTNDGVEGVAVSRIFWLEDCTISGFQGRAIWLPSTVSIIERVTAYDCAGGGVICGGAADGATLSAVLVYDCASPGIQHTGDAGLVEHCTVIGCAGASSAVVVTTTPGPTVRNLVVVDNATPYGIQDVAGLTVEGCCSWSSNPAVYHTTANFLVSILGTTNSEDDPQIDGDFYPIPGGCAWRTGIEPTTTPRDVDDRPFSAPPSRGALEALGVDVGVADENETVWNADQVGEPITADSAEPMALGRSTLRHAALASHYSDRRAASDDPEIGVGFGADRRGWWADKVHGDEFGSRMWLLDRALATDESATRAEEYTAEGQQWLIEQQIATAVTATAELTDHQTVSTGVLIERDERGDDIDLRFEAEWGDL